MASNHQGFRTNSFGSSKLIARLQALSLGLGQWVDGALSLSKFHAQRAGTKSLGRARRRFKQELCFEALEERRVLAGNTSVFWDGMGNLRVQDVTGKADAITVRLSNNTVFVEDPTNTLIAGPGVTQIANSIAAVPLASIAHQILIFTEAGTDLVTVDFGGGNPIPSDGLFFDGGTGTSGLTLGNGAFQSSVLTQPDADNGTVHLERNVAGVPVTSSIYYNTKTNVTSTITSDLLQLKYTGGSESINLSNVGSGHTASQSIVGGASSGVITVKNPTTALEVLATNGTDTINVSSFASGGGLTIRGDDVTDSVNINGIVSVGGPGLQIADVGTVDLALASSDVSVTGTGIASITALRNIRLSSGASVVTEAGNLALSANQQNTATSGNFVGVSIASGIVQSGTGALTIQGKGGSGSGTRNIGVEISGNGSLITSLGGNVAITGNGNGPGSFSFGVAITTGAQVSAGGTGSVSVVGNGSKLGGLQFGTYITGSGSRITSSGGDVSVTGTGGGETGSFNYGVYVENGGEITAGNTGNVAVTGTGGNGTGGNNRGVFMSGTSSEITSGGGNVSLVGVEGPGSDSFALWFASGAAVSTTALGGDISLIGNGVNLEATAVVNASPSNTVILKPRTAVTLINLGGSDTSGTLGITDAELDRITAGTVLIGDTNSGAITVSAGLSHSNHLSLISGSAIDVQQSLTMAAAKNLTVSATNANGTITLSTTTADIVSSSGSIKLSTPGTLVLQSGASIATASGDMNLLVDRITINATAALSSVSGIVKVAPWTSTRLTNVGSITDVAANTLELSDAELDLISGSVQLGDLTSGAITISAPVSHSNDLSIVSNGAIDIQQAITMAANKNLALLSSSTISGISLSHANSDLATSGSGSIAMTAARDISTVTGSSVIVEAGNLNLSANQQITPTSGDFTGIDIVGAKILATGAGSITILGKGGDTGANERGVSIRNPGTNPDNGARVESQAGDITIKGRGGAGTVSNIGVFVTGVSTMVRTLNGGNIDLDGQGGPGVDVNSTALNRGVSIQNGGNITASNSGSVTVNGASGPNSIAVNVSGVATLISTVNGDVVINGRGSSNANPNFLLGNSGNIEVTGNGDLTLVADTMSIGETASGTINVASGFVALRPNTAGRSIHLASPTDTQSVLDITDAELDRITASNLQVGGNASGSLAILGPLTRTSAASMRLMSGNDILFNGGSVNTAGGSLLLTPGSTGFVRPNSAGVDSHTGLSELGFAPGTRMAVVLNGINVDTEYTQLNLAGAINLTGVDLALSGNLTPANGQSFTVVKNDGTEPVVGTFNGLPEGTVLHNFFGSGYNAFITYAGGDGNDVILTAFTVTKTLLLSNRVVNENQAANQLVGNFSVADGTPGTTTSFALVAGAGDVDNSSFSIDANSNLRTTSTFNYEAKSNYSIRVKATDTRGQSTEQVFIISVTDLPELIGAPIVGDGTSQRSLVTKVTLVFDGPVTWDAGAFTLEKRTTHEVVTTLVTQTQTSAGQTQLVITFSGPQTRGTGALIDGYYQLTIDGAKIHRGAALADLNADGTQGDSLVVGAAEADNFFALYGDTNGDGLVGVAEFGQFRSGFGKTSLDNGYNALFDYDVDQAIGVTDFGQFRSRFGKAKLMF